MREDFLRVYEYMDIYVGVDIFLMNMSGYRGRMIMLGGIYLLNGIIVMPRR